MSVYVLNEIPSSLSHCGSLYDEVETHLALNYSAFILHCVAGLSSSHIEAHAIAGRIYRYCRANTWST
jgi:hypothetical protein